MAANYRQASRARSSAEVVSKTDLCTEEADESMLWLELLNEDSNITSEHSDWLLQESNKLIVVFATMLKEGLGRRSET